MTIEEIFESIIAEGRHDPGAFKCVFLCGAPGSGKSSIENRLGLRHQGLKPLNADGTKYYLEQSKRTKQVDYPAAGSATERRFGIWANNYLGLIVNTTGRNADVILRLNKQLQNAAYDTFMIYVAVDEQTARERIQSRVTHATDPMDINREVNEKYFNEAYPMVVKNVELYSTLFGENFCTIDNNGSTPDSNDFEQTRKKINKFLSTPLKPEAQQKLAGIKPRNPLNIGRKFSNLSA